MPRARFILILPTTPSNALIDLSTSTQSPSQSVNIPSLRAKVASALRIAWSRFARQRWRRVCRYRSRQRERQITHSPWNFTDVRYSEAWSTSCGISIHNPEEHKYSRVVISRLRRHSGHGGRPFLQCEERAEKFITNGELERSRILRRHRQRRSDTS
ncbi:hypothetical protein B0H16DRAFT_719062 [Mycena metata]|uniref:Uncharacterized protein n=1 Tax=Mycena metata TaxID=1033252 RepID=A0AAD7M747_9AGAR|nr:hypothetical protein B0H16DRAFT_719062 [Mycena metata]